MSETVIVSFKVPAQLVERLDELIEKGFFRNRSEALRYALVMLVSNHGGRSGWGRRLRSRREKAITQTEGSYNEAIK